MPESSSAQSLYGWYVLVVIVVLAANYLSSFGMSWEPQAGYIYITMAAVFLLGGGVIAALASTAL